MRISRWTLALPLFLMTAAVVAKEPSSGERELDRMLAGRTPGQATACLAPGLRSDMQTVSGIGIVYRAGRTSWVNRFRDGCPLLGAFDIVVTVSAGGPLCRGEVARIVDSTTGMFRGTCLYGDFTPYTKGK